MFDCTVPNNTLSRAELSYDEGTVLNVHYGDVLIKYGSVLDVQKDDIPRIPHRCREDFNGALLQDGDIIIADTAEDETTGKACEISNLQGSVIVSGLHTMVCRPRNRMALGYLGYYLNSNAYHHQLLPLMQGIKVLSLSRSNIQKTSVSYPTAVKEQQHIAYYFSQLDNLITLHQRQPFLHSTPEISLTVQLIHPFYTSSWEQRKFSDITFPAGEKNRDNLPLESYSITNEHGFVPQDEKFENGGTMREADKRMYYIVSPNSFAYNPARINVGSIGYQNIGKNVIVSSLYEVFKTSEDVDDRLLWHWFKSPDFQKLIMQLQEGGVRLYFYYDKLCMGEVSLPSLEEQRKIGKLFDTLDNLITLHQRKYEKLTNVKKSMLEKMFPQNGSSFPEIRFKGFTDPWEQRKLSELTSMHARIGWQNLRTSEFLDSGNYMLITGTDFNDGAINFSTCHYVERERYEQDRNIQIHNGSILITKDGTLGKVAYVQGLSMPATLNAGVFNVQIKDANNVDEKYLFQYLKAPFLMDYVDKKATGGTIKHLNQSILVDFPVILPQRSEQTLIGAFFQQLDNLITLHQRKGKAAVTGCSNDANNSKGVYCKARDFGYKCYKKVKSQQIRCLIAVFIFFV